MPWVTILSSMVASMCLTPAAMPPAMLNSMGEAWRKKNENLEALKKEEAAPQ